MNLERKAALAIALIFILSGCFGDSPPYVSEEPGGMKQTVAIKQQPDEYSLFYEQEYPVSLYEPETGCYLGAYVLSNREINFDIKKFDELTGKDHAVSLYNLKAGNPFPDMWVISCIAAKKTPYFVFLPPNEYNPYDYPVIDSIVEAFGEFKVPIFIDFYPISGLTGNPQAYINFFRYSRQKFKEKAPNVSFVWTVNAKEAIDLIRYYPGDAYVDWVGLNAVQPLIEDGYGADIFNAIDYFYYTYQKYKPIAISQIAISHYTNTDYIFKNQIASCEIDRVYSKIINYYPRIKMINYLDYDEKISDPKKKSDYYTVTENDVVLSAYKDAVSDSRFLSLVSDGESKSVAQLMRSPFPVLKIGEYWYASEYSFKYDLNTKGVLGERLIDGRKYYNINFFARNGQRRMTIDDEAQNLFLTF